MIILTLLQGPTFKRDRNLEVVKKTTREFKIQNSGGEIPKLKYGQVLPRRINSSAPCNPLKTFLQKGNSETSLVN